MDLIHLKSKSPTCSTNSAGVIMNNQKKDEKSVLSNKAVLNDVLKHLLFLKTRDQYLSELHQTVKEILETGKSFEQLSESDQIFLQEVHSEYQEDLRLKEVYDLITIISELERNDFEKHYIESYRRYLIRQPSDVDLQRLKFMATRYYRYRNEPDGLNLNSMHFFFDETQRRKQKALVNLEKEENQKIGKKLREMLAHRAAKESEEELQRTCDGIITLAANMSKIRNSKIYSAIYNDPRFTSEQQRFEVFMRVLDGLANYRDAELRYKFLYELEIEDYKKNLIDFN